MAVMFGSGKNVVSAFLRRGKNGIDAFPFKKVDTPHASTMSAVAAEYPLAIS